MATERLVQYLPTAQQEKILKSVIAGQLEARENLGWDDVNHTILTRNALAKRRNMGWELVLDHFWSEYGEEEEEEEEEGGG